jgi:diadenosine tetraphosphate (Ap4A) HIT family hydrolase
MMVAKLINVVFITAILAGCAGTPTPTTAIVQVDKPAMMLPNVDQVRLRDVDWYVITRDAKPNTPGHIDAVWKKTSKDSLFAVTSDDYEDLSLNVSELTKIIKQLQSQVQAYKEYYQPEKPKENQNGQKK